MKTLLKRLAGGDNSTHNEGIIKRSINMGDTKHMLSFSYCGTERHVFLLRLPSLLPPRLQQNEAQQKHNERFHKDAKIIYKKTTRIIGTKQEIDSLEH